MKESNNNPINKSRPVLLLAGLSFIAPLVLIYLYNNSLLNITLAGIPLKKITNNSELIDSTILNKSFTKIDSNLKQKIDSAGIKLTTNPKDKAIGKDTSKSSGYRYKETFISDTIAYSRVFNSSGQRIMIMGDSECGGLLYEVNDYCVQNGHQLVSTLIWNSATILNFAYSDTVVKIINKYQPTYIFIIVGLNEIYATDLKNRKSAAEILAKKIKGIPYAWIGPANYAEDRGINNVFASAAEAGSFFLSKRLDLSRGSDGRHPNSAGYRIWMDSIAKWLETEARFQLTMKQPANRGQRVNGKVINLNAAKYRGY